MAHCVTCTAPTDLHLCNSCLRGLLADLDSLVSHWRIGRDGQALPGLATELTTTTARQDRIGGGPIGIVVRTAETELPVNFAAADRARQLRGCLSTWVRDLWETHGVRDADGTLPQLDCADTIPAMAAWLQRHPNWLAIHPAADELHNSITGAIKAAQHAIDRPADRVYCGPCGWSDCNFDLYARPDDRTVRCPGCNRQHDVDERRSWLLEEARHHLGTSTEVAGFVRMLGIPCTPAAVRNHADRGSIHPHGTNGRGHPLYRVGEAYDAALRAHQRRKAS